MGVFIEWRAESSERARQVDAGVRRMVQGSRRAARNG
jgi:hypothetical protein